MLPETAAFEESSGFHYIPWLVGSWPLSFFSRNLSVLNARFPDLAMAASVMPGEHLKAMTAANGRTTLLTRRNDRRVSLHSRFDPEEEAERLAGRLDLAESEMLVVLGLGLGYHLKAALRRLPMDLPVIVVEEDLDVLRAAARLTDLTDILSRPGLDLLVARPQEEVLAHLARISLVCSFARPALLKHQPSIQARPEYYQPLVQNIETAAANPLGRRLIYPRLHQERQKVLVLNSNYYLSREIKSGLEALGHQTAVLDWPWTETGASDAVRELLETTALFRPDFLLTVNHLGFDQNGILAELLHRMRLPCASWFVDSPDLILDSCSREAREMCSIFLWDSDYIPDVKALGFDKVHYLPLATDETQFRPISGRPNPLNEWSCRVGFVGDTMTRAIRRKMERLGDQAPSWEDLARAAHEYRLSPERSPRRILRQPRFESWAGRLSTSEFLEVQALVSWKATQFHRLEALQALAPLNPTVIGDGHWREFLDEANFCLRPEISYYEELPRFYPVCDVNLNVTSRQMKNGLNQRVFDVPACGAFLLTDRQGQLADLFDPGRDVITYETPDEALDLARYYRDHEADRLAVIARARCRVLAEHTYRHRLNKLIETMKADHLS